MEDTSTYPTDIKLYERLRIIGRGSFGQVNKHFVTVK